jgi:hypothetical protein
MSEELEQTFLELTHAIQGSSLAEQFAAGYRLATLAYKDFETTRVYENLLCSLDKEDREMVETCLPVQCYFTDDELAFEICTECFPEPEPIIGVVQDASSGAGFRPGNDLIAVGTAPLPDSSWFGDDEDDDTNEVSILHLFKCAARTPTSENPVLISEGIGEFCVEIYHMSPDNGPKRIFIEDFCLK